MLRLTRKAMFSQANWIVKVLTPNWRMAEKAKGCPVLPSTVNCNLVDWRGILFTRFLVNLTGPLLSFYSVLTIEISFSYQVFWAVHLIVD
jgi:hypothetical protein